eukprot:gnl/TRDRNA2_/TRDRNA2_112556_c0_seq1.p1 gnl/TRDRNA2_/TRDRNA2_112556_c0~~gnl/TRDRNA2_/TRDRNA2_112556_c0_seq1.p1  ORF type:complete len:344 (-),score=48.56 gnl/TRDRNA2_/TRDRNA2_112556_c0_seq1:82-1071(-)
MASTAGTRDGLLNGHAIESYPNGDKYDGDFQRGERHGQGVYYHSGGARGRYEGQFVNGQKEGDGAFFLPRGGTTETYVGQWKSGKRHGEGVFTYYDGSVYEGEWRLDLRHGTGRMTFPSKDYGPESVFTGKWFLDNKHGCGHLSLEDGTEYMGNWAINVRSGLGCLKFPNGSKYEGSFAKDLPDGAGILDNVDEESLYTGQFIQGCRSGDGSITYKKTGERFVGQWKDNSRHCGTQFATDGCLYNVEYKNDTMMKRELLTEEEQQQLREKDKKRQDEESTVHQNTRENIEQLVPPDTDIEWNNDVDLSEMPHNRACAHRMSLLFPTALP